MPAKNAIKVYAADSYYHVYNRGVEKRMIFLDLQDYNTFRYYLGRSLRRMAMHRPEHKVSIELACLMPNHFHLLIFQSTQRGMEWYMHSLMSSYVKYFNDRYRRIGGLCQGRYRAVRIKTDDQFLKAQDYIMQNPVEAGLASRASEYKYLYKISR